MSIPLPTYRSLVKQAIRSGHAHLADLGPLPDGSTVHGTAELAYRHQARVILPNHDFVTIPKEDGILHRLHHMEELGVNMVKAAVIPRLTHDVLTLLSATDKAS